MARFSIRVTLSLLLPILAQSMDTSLGAVLNLAYGHGDGLGDNRISNISAAEVFNHIRLIQQNGLTAIANFMLNVDPGDINNYNPLLQNITGAGIPIYPALGQPDNNKTINSMTYQKMALGYANFTDRIQVDGAQLYVENGFEQDLRDFLDFLNNTAKFKHIQMNTWPIYKNGTAYTFTNPAVDSAMEQVMLNNNTIHNPQNPNNWKINSARVSAILQSKPTARIIINYENQPEEQALASLSTNEQLAAFNTTIQSIIDFNDPADRVHWTAPWSKNYDPFAQHTWGFFLDQFAKGNPP